MLHTRSLLIGAVAGFATASLGVGFAACQKGDDEKTVLHSDDNDRAPALPPQSDEELATPLAKVDSVVITVGEFQERINRQSPYIRARYTSLEQKREFLDNMIRFEVLAKEAFERGFDKDPEVIRTMKQVMIQKLMKAEFENKVNPDDITEEEMRAFYEEHRDEYNKPEEVRVSAIILDNRARAKKVAEEALGDKGETNKGFRDLVNTHSVDEGTKIRGGDLRYFSDDTTEVPKPVVEAAFAIGRTGDVVGPIDAGNGKYYIIKQTGKRKEISKAFEDVERQIKNRIFREKRTDAQKDFLENLRDNAEITVFEQNLAKVKVDTRRTGAKAGRGRRHGRAPSFPADDNKPESLGKGPR